MAKIACAAKLVLAGETVGELCNKEFGHADAHSWETDANAKKASAAKAKADAETEAENAGGVQKKEKAKAE